MDIIRTPAEMTAWSRLQRQQGKTISLVPTMGYFHEGHLSLMRLAADSADLVVVSLFVNPTQFGPGEDFASYPRDFERDVDAAREEKVDVVFAPEVDDMYPGEALTTVNVKEMTEGLCGASRPGHFNGVTTVVTKLFNIVEPDSAVFGEKDYQQLAVIRRMASDLNMNIEIIGHPIVREKNGLALSSRNTYLGEEDGESALCLVRCLKATRAKVVEGVIETPELKSLVEECINNHPGAEIDYADFVDSLTLQPVSVVDKQTLLVMAVKINNKVRLLDNGFIMH
ncbi:MAG: pantoate--beta-alanine ligase [Desulfobulbaceae bacterium]|nr:pantoate--beta-alanine ligase [Desulfobulbaceae bacterium]